jgi:trk system potassium uptake protein TrkA
MGNHKFAVIGLGRFGSAIAQKLSKKNAEVLAIDEDEEKVQAISDEVAYAVTLDSTDSKSLIAQNIQDMDAVVVAIGANFQDLLLTTFILQELKVKRIIARAQGVNQRRILQKMGITEILSPEDEVSNNVAEQLVNPGILMCMQLPDNYEIVEVKAPPSISNRSMGEIGLRAKYKINLVTLLRQGSDGKYHIIGVPQNDTLIEADDIIILFGKIDNINRFIEINA